MSVEMYTNDELLDELMNRPTFKGLIVCSKGVVDNTREGDGGMKIRVSKGIQVIDLMTYLEVAMTKVHEMFPKAFNAYFQDRWI